ncbi:unnamed protein product [Arabidopsis lyrata]|uniref:C2H2-type domain-containing protein n=1 Tax=Arabidopsis lyrata subsp. lyrata TaxID=81972 RepID=D7MU90_ARALL|nr:hypothetical protein ARALYDRAFT_495523 [Arabidopsis lyrata subsp. lyrata]CAH8279647.1 unnamed protein product [Arabidopsis lyrata]
MEVLEEKETVNNPPQYYNKIYICYLCKRAFPTHHALGGHGTTHKEDREMERQQIESRLLNKDKSNLLFGGSSQDVLSNDNHLGLSLGPLKSIEGSSSSSNVNPLLNVGVPRGPTDMNMNMNNYSSHALSTDDINLDLTLGPSKSIGGSNNIINNSSFDGNLIIPVCPRVSTILNIPPSITLPHLNINLSHDSFSLQENGSGSSHS